MSRSHPAKSIAKAVVKADKDLTHAAARHREHPGVRLARWASEIADQPQLIALSVATLGVGLAARRRDLARGGARMLAAHLVATAARAVVKNVVDRARPAHALDTGDERFERGDGADDTRLNSFPSGHTAGAVAVARAASREIDRIGPAAATATAAIAAAQPPTGKHYLLDVAAGAVVGWASEAVVNAALAAAGPAMARAWTRRRG